MKVLIIGGVAAGTKVAAKLKREDRSIDVEIYTLSEDISYAGCGLPYYVGGSIKSKEALVVNSPKKFIGLTGATVYTGMKALHVNPNLKQVKFLNVSTNEEFIVNYDKLVLATGASPFIPNIEGINLKGVFSVRTPEDAVQMREYITQNSVQKAVVVGAGFIGMEMCENLQSLGIKVSVLDLQPQILPNIFDVEMSGYVSKYLENSGLNIKTNTQVLSLYGTEKVQGVQTQDGKLDADMVIMCIGIKPNTLFLQDSGIEMNRGTIIVNDTMETNISDIYAVGDCAQVYSRITGNGQWSPMGSTANITGRILAKNLAGNKDKYNGVLGTGVCKVSDKLSVGRTGLTEIQAKDNGYNIETVIAVNDDKAHYYPGAGTLITKMIVDKETHKLLGVQVIGNDSVDKMIDIAVVGIANDLKVEEFDDLDFAYAPPFSTAIHPFAQVCYIMENKLNGAFETITPKQYIDGYAKDYIVVDAQPVPQIKGAKWIDLNTAENGIDGISKETKILLICTKGKRAYLVQNKLKYAGYTNTKVLEGGVFFNFVK